MATFRQTTVIKVVAKEKKDLAEFLNSRNNKDNNIHHKDSIEIDKYCLKKGFGSPMLTAHESILETEKIKHIFCLTLHLDKTHLRTYFFKRTQ